MAKLRAVRNVQCCARCHFVIERTYDGPTNNELIEFHCHRYPPQVTSNADGDTGSSWPKVDGDDQCGEFKRQYPDRESAIAYTRANPEPQ